jgi:hypothetical protein
MQAHLKAAQADAKPKLLKELSKKFIVTNSHYRDNIL